MKLPPRNSRVSDAPKGNPDFAAVHATPYGRMGIRTANEALTELVFLHLSKQTAAAHSSLAQEVCRQIDAFVADPDFRFDLPLTPLGTPFQRRVWDAIAAIPRGRTRTYGDIARDIGSAPRAVGQACGANFFPLVIPCHRVVAASGLGGFAHHDDGYHLQAKRWLLSHEAANSACVNAYLPAR